MKENEQREYEFWLINKPDMSRKEFISLPDRLQSQMVRNAKRISRCKARQAKNAQYVCDDLSQWLESGNKGETK